MAPISEEVIPMAENGKVKRILLWLVSALLALLFAFAGGFKLANPAQAGEQFVKFGYPGWFATLIGVIELVGGLLLLVPRVAAYAAGAIAVVMAGAVFTHLRAGEVPQSLFPLGLLILAVLVGLARRKN
jgi:uncharacterized membrane protein YphA (DoxX/SURF4 family)